MTRTRQAEAHLPPNKKSPGRKLSSGYCSRGAKREATRRFQFSGPSLPWTFAAGDAGWSRDGRGAWCSAVYIRLRISFWASSRLAHVAFGSRAADLSGRIWCGPSFVFTVIRWWSEMMRVEKRSWGISDNKALGSSFSSVHPSCTGKGYSSSSSWCFHGGSQMRYGRGRLAACLISSKSSRLRGLWVLGAGQVLLLIPLNLAVLETGDLGRVGGGLLRLFPIPL